MTAVKNLSGIYAATDILMGHKPFYEKPKPKTESKDLGFQKVLDREIDKLKEK